MMKGLAVALAGFFLLPFLFVVAVPLIAVILFLGSPISPSEHALNDIPGPLLDEYLAISGMCPGLPSTVVAAIGKIESDHGRFGGGSIQPDGRVTPEIIGVRLDGSNNTAVIHDTDDGLLDGDVVFDRAVGPFQFIPSSWAEYGVDGNADGVVDPHNIGDAVRPLFTISAPLAKSQIYGPRSSDTTTRRSMLRGFSKSRISMASSVLTR